MIYNANELIKIIHDTKAVSIWNHETGPVFWYAASVPGPFYVNTELVLGPALADKLLKTITAIVTGTTDPASRASQLKESILAAYNGDENYKRLIATMADTVKKRFPEKTFTLVSGGERRDWLFSVPFAEATGARHLYIFKDKSVYCKEKLVPSEETLHVADLINNAASYFDAWFPAFEKTDLKCGATVCVNSRGTNGVQKLEANGQVVIALNSIDISFFEKSLATGLINKATLDEIAAYFASPKEWAAKYLMGNKDLFDVEHTDAKSLDRLKSFFTNDPWGLRADHKAFFAEMLSMAEKRRAA